MERKPTGPQAPGTYGEREGNPLPSPAREDFVYLIIPLPCPFSQGVLRIFLTREQEMNDMSISRIVCDKELLAS